ncbi:MAG: 1-(5-phosphoribosyl)-5-[(5-phosphoribosylamino)methylideneamino]imidazole-4-carboxamide isomerase [Clostridium sp.]
MIIIPAIDIINGEAVRLYKGDYSKKEVVADDIFETAKKFESLGSEYIHIVDLDGAKVGRVVNKDIILKLCKELKTPIEVGGGIRSLDTIKELIDGGVSRVILGTSAIEDKQLLKDAIELYGDKIAVGVDCLNGYAYGRGWLEGSELYYIDFIKELKELGVKNVIVTDISKDGTLQGVNVDMLKTLKEEVDIDITASGGVKDISDIEKLLEINVYGAITGKAIYSGLLSLEEAIACTQKE